MKIFCVRIGNKYGPEYEQYLEEKLPNYKFHWIRQAFAPGVMLQWNKMLPMGMEIDEPIIVMDIDLLLINDYEKIFEYPVERGQFVSIPDWWNEVHIANGYSLNGGFYKYYPSDTRAIFDKFISNKRKWQQHYIENGMTSGPVNGEQYFVEDSVKEIGLELKLMPVSWIARWSTPESVSAGHLWVNKDRETEYLKWQWFMNRKYKELTGNEYLFLDDFYPDVKMVHFTHSINKPHEWINYFNYK
jgi:hypothetical protein